MEIAVDRLGGDTRIPRPFYSIKISRLRRKAALCAAPLSTVSTNSQMIRLHFPARGLALNTKNILHLLPLRNSARFRKLARSKTICPREEGRGVNLFIINDGILNEYTSEKRGGGCSRNILEISSNQFEGNSLRTLDESLEKWK